MFFGKDSRVNMETNLMSFEKVNKPGWLFEDVKYLVEELGTYVTYSGDTPWLNRLIMGHTSATDCEYISRAGIWLPNPPDLTKDAMTKVKQLNMIRNTDPKIHAQNIKDKMIYPTTVFYELDSVTGKVKVHDKNGYRTAIQLSFRELVPKNTVVYLQNGVMHIIPDGCHSAARTVEKDLKLLFEYLLSFVSSILIHIFSNFQFFSNFQLSSRYTFPADVP